jgi:hypothetical protein
LISFSFDLDVSGDIGSENPHSGGLSGTVRVQNHASGGANLAFDEQFAPGATVGSWNSTGESVDWVTFNSLVDVTLSGTADHTFGGVNTAVALSYQTATHSVGTSANRFTLESSRQADQPVSDEDPWLQIVGISLARSIARSEHSQSGESSGGSISQTTRTRSEYSSWSQLLGPETEPGDGQWGDGGKAVDDYFFSLSQSSEENEPLSLPLGATGTTLSGQAYSNSSQSMTATSNEGLVYGDGPSPPGIAEELLGDIPLHLVALPIIPEGLGVAAGPPADDPDAADDWASGSYGRMSVSNVGTTASGFSLGGGYSLDAGGGSPAQATRSIASHQSSGYEFTLSSRKDGQTGQWRNTAGSRETSSSWDDSSSFIVSGGWGSTTPGLAISGTFVDSQSASSSGSSTASGQLDPASDTWSEHASSRFDQDVATVRTSNGSGDYWHDRYGFDVSGTITVANEHRFTSHHSTSHVYADGSLTPESTGSRYTELITHSLLNSSGGGFDDRTLVSSGPILNHLGDAIGSSTSTTTLDHSVNEGHLRDFHTSDRSDWRFDLATGTLVPTQRVQVDSHVIDVSLDLVHDTTVQTQRAGSYTLDQRNHEFEGESESRTREAISSGQNSTRTVTRTTPHEGPGAGVTILVVSGTDDVSHHDFAWLQSHSGVSTSEIHGSDGYYRYQTDTDDTLRTTFDSVHSVQRIDGSGDTRYHGNRGLAGDGWNSDWYEETPSGGGIEVSQGSYHLALTHDDDRPNAYDVTVASGSAASVELPGPYRLPTNPQANTPPSGTLGPGGFSAPEDPSEVADLQNQVAAAGSSAAAANAAHNANFLMLAQSPGNPETPGSPASEGSLQGSATMKDYVQSQIGTPESANPAAIAAGATGGLSTNVSGMIGGRADLCEKFPDTCLANELVVQRYTPGDIAADQAGFGVWNALSIVVGFIPIVGSIQSVVEFGTGHDHIGGEPTSRWLAAGGIFAGVLPGGKGLLKGGSKAVTMVVRHADDVPAKQVVRAVGSKWGTASKLADNLANRDWPAASIEKAIARHAGENYTSWVTSTGKRIYENPATGRQIVHDLEGGYFRIFQPSAIGSQKGTYLNMLGNELRPARIGNRGVHNPLLRDVDKRLWQQESHFFVEELLQGMR